MLLDYIDDEKAGLNSDAYDWMYGKESTRTIDRMRDTTPGLYQVIQVRRNLWSRKIEDLLDSGGSTLSWGLNHVLGQDGIISLVEKNCKGCNVSKAKEPGN